MMNSEFGIGASPFAAQMFGNAAREHMQKYGTTKEHLAKIAYKNHKHSVKNPYVQHRKRFFLQQLISSNSYSKSQFQDEYTLEQILQSKEVHEPLTKLQCCPTSDGSAAAILASEEFVKAKGLQDRVTIYIKYFKQYFNSFL